jgi:hypothetical protein
MPSKLELIALQVMSRFMFSLDPIRFEFRKSSGSDWNFGGSPTEV